MNKTILILSFLFSTNCFAEDFDFSKIDEACRGSSEGFCYTYSSTKDEFSQNIDVIVRQIPFYDRIGTFLYLVDKKRLDIKLDNQKKFILTQDSIKFSMNF